MSVLRKIWSSVENKVAEKVCMVKYIEESIVLKKNFLVFISLSFEVSSSAKFCKILAPKLYVHFPVFEASSGAKLGKILAPSLQDSGAKLGKILAQSLVRFWRQAR